MSTIIARVHQGRYDTEGELKRLRENGLRLHRVDLVDAVNQRLKKRFPKIYQRLVGPVHVRRRSKVFKCYCNHPGSHFDIYQDIKNGRVHRDSLMCDDCWKFDITPTWGYYGVSCRKISLNEWRALCDSRASLKFVG